ncbi:SpoIIE family protein phosphatase [Oleiagrimonas soli]|uniref:Anti-sigma factor antagonist n=1 Tax=Oleiagrimonas soli TaxID=1543381 RepID=A0A099CT88_9GAMM|nr:SpoIIE family protein phosphatase [Oleiagrimonas soli]KGI77178.1 anti-sigma factor antagonist [Oleiagrimonas soli]MBB6185654.1 sigma-B regulation protein RsbU (phosphoserine phosphatase) [Oleiagrimonas soli]
MGWRSISIASRLALWALLGSMLVLAISGTILFIHTRDTVLAHTHREAGALARGAASRIEARLDRVVVSTQQLAALIDPSSPDADKLLRQALKANHDLSGLAVAFRPGDGTIAPAPFVSRDSEGRMHGRDLRDDPTHYWQQNWFLGGLTCRKGCWQRPFFSKSRQRWLINFSVAIVRKDKPIGLVNADVSLDWLRDILGTLRKPDGAQAFVMGGDGVYLAHDRHDLTGHPGSPALLKALAARNGAPALLSARHAADLDEASWLYGAPIKGSYWSLGLLVPERRIYAPLRHLFIIDLSIGTLALLCIALMLLLVTRRMLAPLGVLAARAEHIARGETAFELPDIRGRDEVGRLTQSFDTMRQELAAHIEQLTEAVRAQQRLSSELEIAQQIQTSLLPSEHYIEARTTRFELHASLRPARAVGGDLYSYFMLDRHHFCVMVGDVSDKGIPAALFMARTITLAKALAAHTLSPQRMLKRLNQELCVGNESCMFVTLLCGVLDLRRGRFTMASAGHDPIMLCNEDGPRLIDAETGPAIGLDEDAAYPSHTVQLHAGDTLLMYTDGITEATDADMRMYGIERALRVLGQSPRPEKPSEYTHRLLSDLDRFVGSADQADDITILALSWHHTEDDGDTDVLELDLPGRIEDVFAALERCEQTMEASGIPGGVREDVRLVLEELMVNMVEHGHTGRTDGNIRLRLECDDDDVRVSLRDNGHPFNPLETKPPSTDTDGATDPEQVGGFGIHLVRAMASELTYSHDDQGNHLQLRFVNHSRMEPDS